MSGDWVLSVRWSALVFSVLAFACPATARDAWAQADWPYYVAEVPFAPDTGVQPVDCQVKSIVKIGNGTRPDWSRDGSVIAFDAPMLATYEVGLMRPDGTQQRCVTCGGTVPEVLQGKHKGKATFHPGGWYLLFGAENEYGDHTMATTPGVGENYDLWVTDVLGSAFFRLTRSPQGSAIQTPRFSPDGKKLLWSERYAPGNVTTVGGELGLWTMKMADFVVTAAGPTLQNIVKLTPGGPGFYEPHGFSPGGSTIIFTAAFRPGVSQFYGEIYTFDLATQTLTKLASADDLHFEQAYFSPDGKKISFMSGPFIGLLDGMYATDLYVMDANGGNRMRLTLLNDPENTGSHALFDKNAWSPDGSQLVAGIYLSATNELAVHVLTFGGQCGKQQAAMVAAVLPSSRSVQVGTPATAFATMINTGAGMATGCGMAPAGQMPGMFMYQATDPHTNQPMGMPNTPMDMPMGGMQTFMFAFTPTAPMDPTDMVLNFSCMNTGSADVHPGLNTFLISASTTPVPDMVALAATLGNDGIVNVPGVSGTGVFAVATVNAGAGGMITVSADTGGVGMPVGLTLCRTDPGTGQCISTMGPTVTTQINASATPTFAIFVTATGTVPFDPANNRVFVRFKDAGGVTRGATSVAVRTQ